MNLLNFVAQYPDETSCRKEFKEYRDARVISHGSKEHYWKQDRGSMSAKHVETPNFVKQY